MKTTTYTYEQLIQKSVNCLVAARSSFGKMDDEHTKFCFAAARTWLNRAEMVCADIESGTAVRAAIINGFCDRLCDACLKSVGEKPFTREEMQAAPLIYQD